MGVCVSAAQYVRAVYDGGVGGCPSNIYIDIHIYLRRLPDVACPSPRPLSSPPLKPTNPPNPPKKGTDEFCGFENVEPEEKPSTYTRRRTFLLKWVGVLLQLAALFAVPVLAGVCYRDLDRCRAIGILDFYKF